MTPPGVGATPRRSRRAPRGAGTPRRCTPKSVGVGRAGCWVYGSGMLVAVFGDAHAHADALDAVIAAAEGSGAQELWSLGDMIGGGPDPERVVAWTRERCTVALVGNHDYGATGSVEPSRLGKPGSPGVRSIELASRRLTSADIAWLRSRKPAARRDGVQCWHGSPRNPVWEYVGSSNADACLAAQRADLGLVGHTHVPAAWQQTPRGARRVEISPGVPLDIATGKWLLNPGAVGAPVPSRHRWWDALDVQAADGAFWLLIDLEARTATWRRAPYDPIPARLRARELGLDDARALT
jgi:predicted phosphodiesterase